MSLLLPHTNRIQGIHVPTEAWRVVTCKEKGCKAYRNGWSTMLLEGDNDFGDKSAYMIRHSGYKFTEEKLPDGFTRFTFEAGQECFRGRAGAHRKRKEGSDGLEKFYVKDRVTGGVQKFTRPADWVDSSMNHQDKLADILRRG